MNDVTAPKPIAVLSVGTAIFVTASELIADGCYRVVYLDHVYGLAFLKRLPVKKSVDDKLPRPTRAGHIQRIRKDSLENLLAKGTAGTISDTYTDQPLTSPEDLKDRQRQIYLKRLPILQSMTQPENLQALIGDNYAQAAKRLSETFQVSKLQVKRLFNRLLEAGLNVNAAAITSHKRCGKHKNREYQKKQGRPRKYIKNGRAIDFAGINTTKEHLKSLDLFIQSQYKPGRPRVENFRKFKALFAIKQHRVSDDGRVDRIMLPDEQFISIDQFSYHLNKRLPLLYPTLGKGRKKAFDAVLQRRVLGIARSGIPFPAHTLIIDSTVADVYLVCAWDRTKLIGRPVIYIVIDAFTSTVVGVHVSLHNPSASEAKIALYEALTDKTDLLKNHGLEAYLDLLPVSPIPYELVFDRAELLSEAGKEIGKSLQINLGVPPAYFPEWKAIVERHFGTLNRTTIHWLPGSTLGRQRERDEKDVRHDAVLTMNEFTKLILLGVIQWNARGKPQSLARPDMQRETEFTAPVDLFEWGLRNLHGTPRYLEKEQAAYNLLPSVDCSIGNRGITALDLHWVSDWMNDASLIRKGSLDQKVKLLRDPHDSMVAWVRLQTEKILRKVSLSAKYQVENGYTYFDIADMTAWGKDTQSIFERKSEGFQTNFDKMTSEVIESAQKLTALANELHPKSKSARVRDIQKNRREEMAVGSSTINTEVLAQNTHDSQPNGEASKHISSGFSDACDAWGFEQ